MNDLVTFADGRMRIGFDRFDAGETYELFKRAKTLPEYDVEFDPVREAYAITAPQRFARMLGLELPAVEAGELPLAEFLFDDQAAVTRMALDAQRFAVWTDCGWGKTLMGLEWGRHVAHRTGGRVLYFTRNEIVGQWLDMAAEFYGGALPLLRLDSRQAMKDWARAGEPGLAVTNYEKLNWSREGSDGQVVREFGHLAGVCLDEGSRLRTAGGRQKWALIKSCEQIGYKLILTATPAPNNVAEFMSQAGFLNKFRAEQSINAFFARDEKTHRWTVKPHARKAFFQFMSSWSIYIRDPRRYGWRKGFADVPPPIVTHHPIAATEEQRDLMRVVLAGAEGRMDLFASQEVNTIQRGKLSQLAKGFRYVKAGKVRTAQPVESRKPKFVAELVRSEVRDHGAQTLVWTVFDAESEILAEHLGKGRNAPRFEVLTGKTPRGQRAAVMERFRTGETQVLISLASMLGFGMNLQHCKAMVFSGFNDGYEAYYQALRRAYRYGQTERLRVHIPVIEELEGDMLDNILRKQSEHEAAINEMEAQYIRAMTATGQLKAGAA